MKKWQIWLIVLIFAVFAAGILYFLFFKKKNNDEILLYGNIEIREVALSFRVSGKLQDLYFEEGDYVNKGQVLARLEKDTYTADLEEAKAKIAQTLAVKINTNDIYKRNLALCADETISKEECKNILTNRNKAAADYDIASAQFQNAKIALSDTELTAPNDGIILTRINEKGTILAPGVPVYSMSLFKPLWARAYIKEEDLGRIKLGQKAYISSDSTRGREFKAHIGFISPVAEFTPKTVETVSLRTDLVYRLRVIIDEDGKDNLYLRQGMPVNIRIPLKEPFEENTKGTECER